MPANVIMPALEMAQETGKVIRWLKTPGSRVEKGEPLVEIETDKITVEIEAPASGVLRDVTALEGEVVPVGRTIAVIAEEGAPAADAFTPDAASPTSGAPVHVSPVARRPAAEGPAAADAFAPAAGQLKASPDAAAVTASPDAGPVKASPLARKIAEQHGVDIAQIRTASGRVEKADVLAYVESQRAGAARGADTDGSAANGARLTAASPKARRLAAERGVDVATLRGSGPSGAVLAFDVESAARVAAAPAAPRTTTPGVSTVWRVMAERMTQSWTTAPHFYLVREVNASRLIAWRSRVGKPITYTDLLVRLVAAALKQHPRAMVSWKDGAIVQHAEVNVGVAVAIEDGLVVPVIQRADTLSLSEIASRREELVTRAQAGKLRPADITGGVFTISNLGMYGVDAFNAIVNPPQAAILAVGRIADRVVPLNGQPAIAPMMVLTVSCDHRALDGARGAQFLGTLAGLVEEPLALLS
jgi:pyruvate dehydrogenase E2 component (dihydrolipoamide acetyltransferase)